jgi:hypothetical protein
MLELLSCYSSMVAFFVEISLPDSQQQQLPMDTFRQQFIIVRRKIRYSEDWGT